MLYMLYYGFKNNQWYAINAHTKKQATFLCAKYSFDQLKIKLFIPEQEWQLKKPLLKYIMLSGSSEKSILKRYIKNLIH